MSCSIPTVPLREGSMTNAAQATLRICASPKMFTSPLARFLVATLALAIGISMIAGKPPADGYHKGLRRVDVAADMTRYSNE